MANTIDISKMDKPAVLMALYDNAKAQGLGVLHYTPEPMAREEAVALLAQGTYFDYVHGRVMKVELNCGDELKTSLYDRDNGDGAAAAALERDERPSGSAGDRARDAGRRL